MERNVIDDLAQMLRVPRRRRHAIARELRTHLEESRRELELAGLPSDQAMRESMQRFGNPRDIAQEFEGVYRPSRRSQLGLAMALATGMVLGAWGIGGQLANASQKHVHSHHVTRVIAKP